MYCSIRDNLLLENFDTPAAGLCHLGVDAVEIELVRDFQVLAMDTREMVPLATDADAKKYAQHLDSLDIRPVSFLTACDFSGGTVAENAQWMARAMELAAILEMDNIRVDSYMSQEKELDFGARVRVFVETLGQALEMTGGVSVNMGIENHGYQGNNLAFLLNVFKGVGSKRLGCTLDTGNFYWRGYPLSEVYGILNVLAPYAKHTHLKNIRYPEETREEMREGGWKYEEYVAPLYEGDIDHAVVLGLLQEAGYTGDVCIEDESLSHFEEGTARVAVLEKDVAYVKALITQALSAKQ